MGEKEKKKSHFSISVKSIMMSEGANFAINDVEKETDFLQVLLILKDSEGFHAEKIQDYLSYEPQFTLMGSEQAVFAEVPIPPFSSLHLRYS